MTKYSKVITYYLTQKIINDKKEDLWNDFSSLSNKGNVPHNNLELKNARVCQSSCGARLLWIGMEENPSN